MMRNSRPILKVKAVSYCPSRCRKSNSTASFNASSGAPLLSGTAWHKGLPLNKNHTGGMPVPWLQPSRPNLLRKDSLQLFETGPAPVLAQLECLDVANSSSGGSIALLECGRNGPARRIGSLRGKPVLAPGRILRHICKTSIHPRQPFVELRYVRIKSIDFGVENIVDRHHHIRTKRRRL